MAQIERMGAAADFERLTPQEVAERVARGVRLVDVREPGEYEAAHIEGAELVPLSTFDPDAFPPDSEVVFHCRSGGRTRRLAEALTARGWTQVTHLEGGILAWDEAGLPVVRPAD